MRYMSKYLKLAGPQHFDATLNLDEIRSFMELPTECIWKRCLFWIGRPDAAALWSKKHKEQVVEMLLDRAAPILSKTKVISPQVFENRHCV